MRVCRVSRRAAESHDEWRTSGGSAIVVRHGGRSWAARMDGVLVELMPDKTRNMLLLNVVCFGAWTTSFTDTCSAL